jgi:hypothetical protein
MRRTWTNAALLAGGGGLALLMILTQTRVQRNAAPVRPPQPPDEPRRRLPGEPDMRQLRVGMHRQVVRNVHGSPAITEIDADRTQRWTYTGPAWGSVVVGFSARGLVERIEDRRS